jgi:hypothetical protein
MRMPERQNRTEDDKLPVRRCLQVWPPVQMQGRVVVEVVSRIEPSGGRCVARANTRRLYKRKGANNA